MSQLLGHQCVQWLRMTCFLSLHNILSVLHLCEASSLLQMNIVTHTSAHY